MLKKTFAKEHKMSVKQISQPGSPDDQSAEPSDRITFEDYEKYLIQLEKEGRLDEVDKSNPRAKFLDQEENWTNSQEHIAKYMA